VLAGGGKFGFHDGNLIVSRKLVFGDAEIDLLAPKIILVGSFLIAVHDTGSLVRWFVGLLLLFVRRLL